MTAPMSTGWPRLTESLRGDTPSSKAWKGWGSCQACGGPGEIGEDLHAWQEHDDRDRREPRAVVLCDDCSDQIIEPHPRLYRKLHEWEPMPGVMELCRDCTHRDGYLCTHPDLSINGGEGLSVTFPKATRMHVRRSGGRSGWTNLWQGPPTECQGREVGT